MVIQPISCKIFYIYSINCNHVKKIYFINYKLMIDNHIDHLQLYIKILIFSFTLFHVLIVVVLRLLKVNIPSRFLSEIFVRSRCSCTEMYICTMFMHTVLQYTVQVEKSFEILILIKWVDERQILLSAALKPRFQSRHLSLTLTVNKS